MANSFIFSSKQRGHKEVSLYRRGNSKEGRLQCRGWGWGSGRVEAQDKQVCLAVHKGRRLPWRRNNRFGEGLSEDCPGQPNGNRVHDKNYYCPCSLRGISCRQQLPPPPLFPPGISLHFSMFVFLKFSASELINLGQKQLTSQFRMFIFVQYRYRRTFLQLCIYSFNHYLSKPTTAQLHKGEDLVCPLQCPEQNLAHRRY